ncbi:MAG: Na-translocating system protein MpsC family protein [Solirubrobacteraceae bacterium]
MLTGDQAANDADPRTTVLTDISKAMVHVFKEQFGRGPTSARAYWNGSDAITVVMENTLTPAERRLVELGEHQRLRDMRTFFQYASIRDLITPVEVATGRKVRAFTSGTDTRVEGLSVETFVLHPEDYDGPSRLDISPD